MKIIQFLKKTNEITPYWLKKPFSRAIRNRLVKNRAFINQYDFLEKTDSISEKEKKEWEKNQLESLLRYAYDNSIYYKRIMEKYSVNPYEENPYDALASLPILTKEILRTEIDSISVQAIKDYYEVSTGGTTGEPTKVYMEKNAIYKEWAFVYHYWSKYGYDFKKSKLATFRGVNLGNKISEINPLYQEIRLNPFLLSYNNIGEYCNLITKYGADYIYGYPSAIYNFCRISKKSHIDLSGKFKAVFIISENLYEFQKEMIESVLRCPIAHFYGHSERAVFGENYGKGYRFNQFYGYTEINENNQPIVTGFINKKTPLINYLVDDNVELNQNGLFNIIGHRSSEVLYGLSGEQISMAAINFHDDTFEMVSAYQFIQNEYGKCVVRIVPEDNFSEKRISVIKQRIQEKLGQGFQIKVEKTDKISLSKRGKYQLLIQNIKE